ncbi:hypothetical protein ACFX11_022390 [Malus domestica]
MLGVWLLRFGGRCLFDFGASNLVGSVFSNVSKGWACLLVYLATEHRGSHTGTFQLSSSGAVPLPLWVIICDVVGATSFTCLNFVRDLWQSYMWYP